MTPVRRDPIMNKFFAGAIFFAAAANVKGEA
jgi:hypothetical protein